MRLGELKLRLLLLLLAYAPGFYFGWLRRGQLVGRKKYVAQNGAMVVARADARPRVLVVDSDFPDPTRDAGSKAVLDFVKLLAEEGVLLSFWSASRTPSARGRRFLTAAGVETGARRYGFDLSSWLGSPSKEKSFDAVVLSRPLVAAMYGADVRRFASNRCLYYGHDIHYLRMQAMIRTTAGKPSGCEQRFMKIIEQRLWQEMDIIFYPSEEEVARVNDYLTSKGRAPNAVVLPLWAAPAPAEVRPSPSGRRGMLFVGSYSHSPNVDGLDWFFSEVLPRARADGCRDYVYVVGSGMEAYEPPTCDPDVRVLGWLSEDALQTLYANVRIALAPLRYGGGIKGKVLEAMAQGVPCVTTEAGAQGMSAALHALALADDAQSFAEALLALSVDDALWSQKSLAGLSYLHANYERASMKRLLMELVLGCKRG